MDFTFNEHGVCTNPNVPVRIFLERNNYLVVKTAQSNGRWRSGMDSSGFQNYGSPAMYCKPNDSRGRHTEAEAVIEALKVVISYCADQRSWFTSLKMRNPKETAYADGILRKVESMEIAVRRELEEWEHPQLTLF